MANTNVRKKQPGGHRRKSWGRGRREARLTGLLLLANLAIAPLRAQTEQMNGNYNAKGSSAAQLTSGTAYVNGGTYACTDAGVSSALSSYTVVDTTGCTTIIVSSGGINVGTAGSRQTLRSSLSTMWLLTASAISVFNLDPNNSHVSGIYVECGTPRSIGNVFAYTRNVVASRGADSATLSDSLINCPNAISSGNGVYFNSPGPANSGITGVKIVNLVVNGLINGISMTTSGAGFINGNRLVAFEDNGSVYGWHITTANGGQINGNTCVGCYMQDGPASKAAWQFDGSTGSSNQAYWNQWTGGEIWDMPTAINWSTRVDCFNKFDGMLIGTVTDSNTCNNWIDLQHNVATLNSIQLIARRYYAASGDSITLQPGSGATYDLQVTSPGGTANDFLFQVGGNFIAGGNVTPGARTISGGSSNLPPASSFPGSIYIVTDSTAISAEGQTCTHAASGAVTALAFSNGSAWKCF